MGPGRFVTFFIATATLLSILNVSLEVDAQTNSALTGIGIAAKGTRSYDDVFSATVETAGKSANLGEFVAICGDADFADQVEWKATDRRIATAIFTCASAYGSERPNEGKTFAFTLDKKNESLITIQEFDFKRDISAKGKTQIVVREVATVIASAYVASEIAKNVYPNESDKSQHAGVEAALAAAFTSIAYHYYGHSKNAAAIIGGVSSCGLGLAKEAIDPYTGGDKSSDDIKADVIGCIVGAAFMRLVLEYQ